MEGVAVAFCWPPCLTANVEQQQAVNVAVLNQSGQAGQAIRLMVVQASGRTLLDVTSFLPSPGFHTMRILLDGSLQAAGHATVSVAPLGRPSRPQQAAPPVPLPVFPHPVAQELGVFFDSLVKARLRAATVRPADTNGTVADVYAAHVWPLLLDLTAVCVVDGAAQPFHELQLVCSRLVPFLHAEQLSAALGLVRHVLGRQDLPVDLLAPLAQSAGRMAAGPQSSMQLRQRGIPYPQAGSGASSSGAQPQPATARLTAQAVALASATAPVSHSHLRQHMGGSAMHRRSRQRRPMLASPDEDGPSGRRQYQAAIGDESDDDSSDESVMLTTYVPAQLEPLAQDPFRPELMQGPDDQSDSDASGVLVDSIMRASCAAEEDTLSYINSLNSACIAALMHPSFDNHGSAFAAAAGTSNAILPSSRAVKGSQLPPPQQPQQRRHLGEERISISGALAASGSRSGPPSGQVNLSAPATSAAATTSAGHTQLVPQHLSPRTLFCGFSSRGLEQHFLSWWCQQQQHADTTGMVAVLLVLAACAATDLFRSDVERATSLAPMALLLLPHMATALVLCAMQAWGGPVAHAHISLSRWMRVVLEAMLLWSLPAQPQLFASLEQSLVARCLLHVLLHSMCRPVLLRSTPMLALAELVPPSAMMLRGGTPIARILLQQAAVWFVSCVTAAAVEHHKRHCFLNLLTRQRMEDGAGASSSGGSSTAVGSREQPSSELAAAAVSTRASAARTAAQALFARLRSKQD